MPLDSFAFTENLLNLAAVVYQPADDVDRLLASFAAGLRSEGRRIGGIVQRNRRGDCSPANLMEVIDLRTGRAIPICRKSRLGIQGLQARPSGPRRRRPSRQPGHRRRGGARHHQQIRQNGSAGARPASGDRRRHPCRHALADRGLGTSPAGVGGVHGRVWHNAAVRRRHRRGLVARHLAPGRPPA